MSSYINEKLFHLSFANSLIFLLKVGNLCQENTNWRLFVIIITLSFEGTLSP